MMVTLDLFALNRVTPDAKIRSVLILLVIVFLDARMVSMVRHAPKLAARIVLIMYVIKTREAAQMVASQVGLEKSVSTRVLNHALVVFATW